MAGGSVGGATVAGLLVLGAAGAVRQRREARAVRAGRLEGLGPSTELSEAPSGALHRRIAAWQPTLPRRGPRAVSAACWAVPNTAVGVLVALLGGRLPRRDPSHRCLVAAPVRGPVAAALRGVGATAATIGSVVISRQAPLGARLLAHEAHHVRQQERLGLLFGPAYAVAQVVWGYRANPFEVAARRAAIDG